MKTLKEIMDMIEFPEMVQNKLLSMESALSLQKKNLEKYIQNLTVPHLWESSQNYLKESLTPDENGFKMLSYMLSAASYSFEKYKEKGISGQIFIDTMKCFTRFITEHNKSYGIYGFDRDFWTGRQLSLQLFRLGELKFETTMAEKNCKASLNMASKFFKEYDPDYVNVPYVCHS